jgi:hypothetical protein
VTRRRAGSDGSGSDLSLARRGRRAAESSDESPPRRPTRPEGVRSEREIKTEADSGDEQRRGRRSHDREKTNNGRRAGLVTMREMREEADRIREEEARVGLIYAIGA